MKKRVLPWLALILCTLLFLGLFSVAISAAVCHKTAGRILSREELLSEGADFDAVVVLGCKVHADGSMSARLEDRVRAGISLFSDGVGDLLLMSGDRQKDGSYDEVSAMRNAALEAGIDEADVAVDPKGYSTYESMVRLSEAYPGGRVVIVTQTYHLYRALYIAEKLGLEAYGFCADARPYSDQLRCEFRELLARPKDVLYTQIRPSVDLAES